MENRSLLSKELVIGNHTLAWGTRTYVMGILNITTDSFSGDGILIEQYKPGNNDIKSQDQWVFTGDQSNVAVRSALQLARKFIEAGVDILDVGGESTRPGAQPVSADLEMDRILALK